MQRRDMIRSVRNSSTLILCVVDYLDSDKYALFCQIRAVINDN